jgi:hypothetical protein
MKRIVTVFFLLAMALILLGGATGCQPTAPPSNLDINAVRAYADPATDTTMQGLSENNLAKYTQNANAESKAAVTQDILSGTAAKIGAQLGVYQSKEFLRAEEQKGYILVHYKGKYAKGDVGIRMVFDQNHLVAGQWFE